MLLTIWIRTIEYISKKNIHWAFTVRKSQHNCYRYMKFKKTYISLNPLITRFSHWKFVNSYIFFWRTNLWRNFKFWGHCIRFASLIFSFTMIILKPSVCIRHALEKNIVDLYIRLILLWLTNKNTKTIKILKIFHRFKQTTLRLKPDSRVYIWSIWSDMIRWDYSVLNHVILSFLKLPWDNVLSIAFSTIKLKLKITSLFLNLIQKKGWIEIYRKNRK